MSGTRFFVKVAASAARELMSRPVQAGGVSFDWEELFSHDFSVDALSGTGECTWLILNARGQAPGANPWDVAHQLRETGLAAACGAGAVLLVEPAGSAIPDDFPVRMDEAAAQDCTPAGQDPSWPTRPEFAWHLLDSHTQLKRARESVDFSHGRRVRIGHVDTGYDPAHVTVPRRLRADLGWNYEKNSSDTVDRYPYSPVLPPYTFGGHGTSTASVLAGGRVSRGTFNDDLGGAPEAEVVPIVATGSVLIGDATNWARSVEWAVARECDVVSMSAGGYFPSRMFFDTTLRATYAGTAICAASGNRFGCVGGTDPVTLPAAYPHVLSVTGALANHEPYYQCWPHIYSACKWKIGSDTQMAAYTTNIAKARRGCRETVDHNGDGTSHSTPQAAAAVALYFQKWQDRLPRDWRRVQAVAGALFASARKVYPDFFYQGILRAHDALALPPRLSESGAAPWPASLSFALFESLPGMEDAAPAARSMLALEAMGLAMRSPEGRASLEPLPVPAAPEQQRALVNLLSASPGASAALRAALDAAARRLSSQVAVPGAIVAGDAATVG